LLTPPSARTTNVAPRARRGAARRGVIIEDVIEVVFVVVIVIVIIIVVVVVVGVVAE
jgi:hypothetical protein